MGFGEAIKTCFGRKYADFHGRASRSEFWFFFLAFCLAGFAASFFLGGLGTLVKLVGFGILLLAIFLPSLAVQVRRVHDTNASGWWVLLAFIPYIGNLIMLVWCCFPGTKGENRFGPDPLNPDTAEAFD